MHSNGFSTRLFFRCVALIHSRFVLWPPETIKQSTKRSMDCEWWMNEEELMFATTKSKQKKKKRRKNGYEWVQFIFEWLRDLETPHRLSRLYQIFWPFNEQSIEHWTWTQNTNTQNSFFLLYLCLVWLALIEKHAQFCWTLFFDIHFFLLPRIKFSVLAQWIMHKICLNRQNWKLFPYLMKCFTAFCVCRFSCFLHRILDSAYGPFVYRALSLPFCWAGEQFDTGNVSILTNIRKMLAMQS